MRLSHGVILYGRTKIEFGFCHVHRRTLEIAVHPDQSVTVKAPLATEPSEIHRRIARRAGWIIKQQKYFRQFEPRTPARCYVSGETHLYLGKRYRLKIKKGRRDEVKLTRGYFEVQVKSPVSSRKIKNLMDEWYEEKAVDKFRESFEYCSSNFKKFHLSVSKLQIKRLKKRWGSLSAKGTLTLNADLIRAPKECIDYVITHEYCHLNHRDHNPKFYACLKKIMPDWEKRKHKLEQTLA